MTDGERWRPRRVWLPALAAALVLLMSFHQVVSGAVRDAHGRQAAASQHAALQRCDGLADKARVLCSSRVQTRWLAAAEGAQAPPGAGAMVENWRR